MLLNTPNSMTVILIGIRVVKKCVNLASQKCKHKHFSLLIANKLYAHLFSQSAKNFVGDLRNNLMPSSDNGCC